MTVTPFLDVEFIVADLLDGGEFPLDGSGTNNVTFVMGENLFGGTVEPPDAVDGEREDLLAIFVKRSGEFEIAEQFCGGGSHYNGRLQIYLRGRPEQKQQTEYLARHVERFLNSQQGIDVPGIMRFYSTSPMAAQSVTQEGSAVCPLYVFTFMIQIDDRFTGASVPSTGVPASGDLDGFFLAPDVVAGHFDGTRLTFGAIDDGQYAKRVGTEIVGVDLDFVPSSRTISTTSPLQGGGDLSTNRTISLADSGVTAAVYGDGANIPVVTVTAKGLVSLASEAPVTVAHINAGGDLGGTLDAPTVDAVHSSGTRLTIGAITDGQVLVRSGTTISSTGAIVPSTRTVTGTAPITVNGVSGTGQALSSDLTVAHATSGVIAAQSPSAINAFKRPMTTVNSFGHVTSLAYVETFLDLHYTRIGVFTDGNVFSNSNFSTLGQEAGTSGGIFPIIRVGVSSANTQGVHRWCATGGSDMPILFSGVHGIITRQVVRITNLPASGTTIDCFGLMNVLSGGSLPNDGVYWAYNTAVSPFWLCVTASGGVRTITTTNKLVTDGEWVDLRTKTSRDRSAAEFYWGDEYITSHGTNVPATTMGLTITISAYRTLATAGINLIGVSLVWGGKWDFVT